MAAMSAITGFHHLAFRCRDTGTTRRFYEDLLGLQLVKAIAIDGTRALHAFFRLGDGSFLAFFEAPHQAFEFRAQHDFDLHVALDVEPGALGPLVARARAAGVEVRGPVDHGIIHSAYLRDPDGYVVELAERRPGHDAALDPASNGARETLAAWQRSKLGDGAEYDERSEGSAGGGCSRAGASSAS